VQHKLRLLDHLVGAAEQRKRARNPKRLGSFEVKYQLDVDGLLDRQISRFVTFEAELLGVVAPVCQMPRRRGGIIRPPLTRAYSRERRFCAERCRCDCVNCWVMRRRLMYWYAKLKALEASFDINANAIGKTAAESGTLEARWRVRPPAQRSLFAD
jgi:hypothetical protein